MSVRTIRKNGQVVAYQAITGAGGPGHSRYFGLATHGAAAKKLAIAAADELPQVARQYRAIRGNTGGLEGMRFELRNAGVPVLYAVVSGGGRCTAYSTAKHGLLGKRDKWAGPTGLTPRQALARMTRANASSTGNRRSA
jgi:hypothetical protein